MKERGGKVPIIAIAGSPHSGKKRLGQSIVDCLKERSEEVDIVKNTVTEFLNKKFEEDPLKDRYEINQIKVLSEQYEKEISLDDDKFHVIITPLFCNYLTAVIDCCDEDLSLAEKMFPEIKEKALECVKSYDFIVFLDFLPTEFTGYMENKEAVKRCKKICEMMLLFLDENKINYVYLKQKAGKERSKYVAKLIEKKFGLSRVLSTQQNTLQNVSCEKSPETNREMVKKDEYLQQFWSGFEFPERSREKERIKNKKWQKR